MLEPPEGHGDHCLVVAVLAAVLAPRYGADPARPFLAGMAHHLHNAALPDSGFAGEMLLGEHLEGDHGAAVRPRAGDLAAAALARGSTGARWRTSGMPGTRSGRRSMRLT